MGTLTGTGGHASTESVTVRLATASTAEIVGCRGGAADSTVAAAVATPAVDYSNNSASSGAANSPPGCRQAAAGSPGHTTIAQSPGHCLLYVSNLQSCPRP